MTEFSQKADVAKRLTDLGVYVCCLLVFVNLLGDWQLLNPEVWVSPPWRWVLVHGLVLGGLISSMLNCVLALGLSTMSRIAGAIYLVVFLVLWSWFLNLEVSFPLLYGTMPSEFVPYLESVLGPDGSWTKNYQVRILVSLGAYGLFLQSVLLTAGWLAWPWVCRPARNVDTVPARNVDTVPAPTAWFSPKLVRLIVLMVGAILLQQSAFWGWLVVLDTFQQFSLVLTSVAGLAILGTVPHGWGLARRESFGAVVFTGVWWIGCCLIVALAWRIYDWLPGRFPALGSFVWPTIFLFVFGLFIGMAVGQVLHGMVGYLAQKFWTRRKTTSFRINNQTQRLESKKSRRVPVELAGMATILLLLPLAMTYLTTSYNLTVLAIAKKDSFAQSKLAAKWLGANENEKSVVVYEAGKTIRRSGPLISIGSTELTRLLITSKVHQSANFIELIDVAAHVVGVDANAQAITAAQTQITVSKRHALIDETANVPPVLVQTVVWATPVNDSSINHSFGSFIPQWDWAAQPLQPADWESVTEIALVGGRFAPTDWQLIPSNVKRIVFSDVEIVGPVPFSSEDRLYLQAFFDQCEITPEVLGALAQVMEVEVRFLNLTPLIENPDLLSRMVFDGHSISLYDLPENERQRFDQVPDQYRRLMRLTRLDLEHWQIVGESIRELILKASPVPPNWKSKAFQSNGSGRISGIVLDSITIAALLSSQELGISGQISEGELFQSELDWVIIPSSSWLQSEKSIAIVRHFVERARWVMLEPREPESSITNTNPKGVFETLREWPSLHSQGRGLILTHLARTPWSLVDSRFMNHGHADSDTWEFGLEYWEIISELKGINVLVLDGSRIRPSYHALLAKIPGLDTLVLLSGPRHADSDPAKWQVESEQVVSDAPYQLRYFPAKMALFDFIELYGDIAKSKRNESIEQ